jgi:hypothetical protein
LIVILLLPSKRQVCLPKANEPCHDAAYPRVSIDKIFMRWIVEEAACFIFTRAFEVSFTNSLQLSTQQHSMSYNRIDEFHGHWCRRTSLRDRESVYSGQVCRLDIFNSKHLHIKVYPQKPNLYSTLSNTTTPSISLALVLPHLHRSRWSIAIEPPIC